MVTLPVPAPPEQIFDWLLIVAVMVVLLFIVAEVVPLHPFASVTVTLYSVPPLLPARLLNVYGDEVPEPELVVPSAKV